MREFFTEPEPPGQYTEFQIYAFVTEPGIFPRASVRPHKVPREGRVVKHPLRMPVVETFKGVFKRYPNDISEEGVETSGTWGIQDQEWQVFSFWVAENSPGIILPSCLSAPERALLEDMLLSGKVIMRVKYRMGHGMDPHEMSQRTRWPGDGHLPNLRP